MKEEKKPTLFRLVWGAIMVVIYFLMAYLLVFSSLFNERSAIPFPIRVFIGVVFLIYGVFRGYRLWTNKK